ncbi:exonuclease V a 5' deoxyribonuclease-domain-containing protein [Pseudomassariella vexata]|uniref:Exonuclease V a 5' deoxyribonuclease-domain-containing protein n=1 Tax=Pseudomassariella vexata TaxID=1141098 RepID=A0A1Y2DFP7_9PEZI|nr:exonuclease V a 5' deoxyribonuclease-domain-containing protein [Pseudomassariella vexata]ORY58091.1 exonuclease V a 5' deoxyribonuclease-domain-containing protein [Pseudomassariella vexata]
MADNRPESDYGSDFDAEEEDILDQLLQSLTTGIALQSAISGSNSTLQPDLLAASSLPFIENTPGRGYGSTLGPQAVRLSNLEPYGFARTSLYGRGRPSMYAIEDAIWPTSSSQRSISYPDLSHVVSQMGPGDAPAAEGTTSEQKPSDLPALCSQPDPAEDTRSPIERFRAFPKKPLTVTDLYSGAWCELQYWYTLTRLPFGRKTRTAAMRGGTKVHQTLEDQVHTTVQISIATKEEAFALRLWNVIQGLRTLRDTGLTRELEVWGVIEGQVINGIIDEVSHTSPNAGLEQELHQSQSSQGTSPKHPSIATYFDPHRRRAYLTDVKTRGSNSLPSGAALRPSKIQLSLYHRLLSDLAAGKLDFSAITSRYGLRDEMRFSDTFMAQIGSLHDEVFHNESDGDSPNSSTGYPGPSPTREPQASTSLDLIRYRSIQQILPLLRSELRDTFPQGAASLGKLIAIQYRHRDDGHIIGHQVFPADSEALDKYLKQSLAWWLGQRKAEGVPIEEAYKCRMCEFAETCEWRKSREDEFLRRKPRTQISRASSGL